MTGSFGVKNYKIIENYRLILTFGKYMSYHSYVYCSKLSPSMSKRTMIMVHMLK